MQVVVLVKSIPDPSGETKLGPDFLVKREGDGVLDPGDEFAVEAALQLAEAAGGEVTAVSMGPAGAGAAIRRALAMGAHGAVLVSDDALRGADALATARVLAAAVGRSPFEVVLAGVESTDGYTGTLPMTVAELLGIPSATFARKVEVVDGVARIERQTEAGYDVVECTLPGLFTVTASAAEPRFPTLKGIMSAKSKPLEELSLADLGLSAADVAPTQRVSGVESAPQKGAGEVITDDGSAAARIADLLADAKVI
ncbi:MAG TPA: electron transfer flavoprotein subunit beta/FixA family protein [Actinomycetota bacterium]|jgi:electron transfer flavoprotein beta subunit|nr:electron transfer flavoprotein subunit beta/FixA family protein [Actinomycetota bacterium]